MLESFRSVYQRIRWRPNEDEILQVMSYNIWRTRYRIEELINQQREKSHIPSLPKHQFFAFNVSRILTSLTLSKIIEFKNKNEFTQQEHAWSQTSGSVLAQRIEQYLGQQEELYEGAQGLTFYRLKRENGLRQRKTEKVPEEEAVPIYLR